MLNTAPVGKVTQEKTDQSVQWPTHHNANLDRPKADHFIERNGSFYAGSHLLLDLWGAESLDELQTMEEAMRQAVLACNATLLHLHLHHFSPSGGISGVAVLAESHISVHTWPERGFAAFDVFMCGLAKPQGAIDVFERIFCPQRMEVSEYFRGRIGE